MSEPAEKLPEPGPLVHPEEPEQLTVDVSPHIQPPDPSEEPINGSCEIIEPPDTETSEGSQYGDGDKDESHRESESSTPKTSRELKSILALSKEAKLDTNITERRKTLDKVKNTKKKHKMTGFPVTAESELENFDVKIHENEKKTSRKSSFSHDGGSEGATVAEVKRGLQGISGDFVMPRKPNKDIFCWRCHHDHVQVACETCPRAYHLRCLKQTITDPEHWPCPECVAILKAENTQTRSKAMKGMSLEHLCSLLKFAVKRMIQCNGSEPFIHPVDEKQFPEYRSYIVQPMTLTLLDKNIKDNAYGSTQAFEADAKWLLHNSIVFNSSFPDQSKLTTAAKTIVKICKQEMAEIENCPSCYLNANTKKNTWFIEVCPRPHLLVWAKLKGFPYWPAKVMSINSQGMADVRFFGAHDKAWVSVKDCYLYSVKDPNSGKQKRNDIIECVKELELYVDNLREIYGRVNFAPFKTLLEADTQMKQLQVFLPNYRGEGKEILWKVKEVRKSVSSSGGDDKSEESSEEDEEIEEEEEKGKKDKSNGEGMTRIDYQVKKPIKILIRKRFSGEDINENSPKVQKNSEEGEEKEEEEEKKESPVGKLRISDQLIKKLEEISDQEKVEEKETPKEDKEKPPEEPEKKPEEPETKKKPIEIKKKRKHEETKDKEASEDNLFPPNKMVKLVPIENILQKKDLNDTPPPPPPPPPPLPKSDQLIVLKEVRVVKDGKEIKNKEPPPPPIKIKNEVESDEDNDVQYMEAKRQYLSALNISEKQKVPVKPKSHEIRTRSKTEEKKSKKEGTPDIGEPPKEIFIKSLAKMQAPKHKARKSFPTPNYSKKTIVARKIVPKTPIDDDLTIVQPTTNVMILPKLHYNKPRDIGSPPVLTLLPRPPQDKKIPEGSQNYIPQNEETAGHLLNNLLTAPTTSSTTPPQPPTVIDVDSIDSDLGPLKDILPENVSKGVSDILTQPPPKLKPKPLGILNSSTETAVPSTAGPVATRINCMAQKLSDYFRSLLIETISDLGKSNNPDATISSLKYEIEELNHKHSIELAEIRRNVSIVLKDIQKSVVEERERIINETKANCEMEMMKRVEEAKSKQWCANCSKEAQFYCCWNTSYCDYPCQQKHWPKHMSKCTQTSGQNQSSNSATATTVRTPGQQLVLTPTAAPKFGALFAKPQKVYLKRTNTTTFKPSTGSHITLVESTPGNFELLGSGPIAVNGKILASTSVIEKIKTGNIVTVTAPSSATNTQLTSVNQKVNMVVSTKSTVSSSESEH